LIARGVGERTLALFYAMSRDGRTFTPRQALPTEDVPRHVPIAVAADGQVVAAWDEAKKGQGASPLRGARPPRTAPFGLHD
jgi:hypothetical protein